MDKKTAGRIKAKAWMDDGYRERLRTNPHQVLADEGVSLPEGVHFKLVEDTDDTVHFVLPARPKHYSDADLDDEKVHADICKPPIC